MLARHLSVQLLVGRVDCALTRIVFGIAEARVAKAPSQWIIDSRMYEYRLLDHWQRELMVYHWQPGTEYRGPNYPHLHVSASLTAQVDAISQRQIGLDKLHVVTGHVSLAAIVRMLIADFNVAPLRQDWHTILDHSEESAD